KEKIIRANLLKIKTELDLSQNIILQDGDRIIVGGSINSVYILGLVNSPGPKTYFYDATVSDYILLAGGFKEYGDKGHVKIIRGDINNPVIIKDINLSNFFADGSVDRVEVEPGDIIMVEGDWVVKWQETLSILTMIKQTASIPRDLMNTYLDLTGQKRPVYVPAN
ncbi:MAG: hypothetical protein KKD35_04400, partial [Elusimicrobia bacterium]|nr:hypothetical protein [Elusimicrobiota bacterium]